MVNMDDGLVKVAVRVRPLLYSDDPQDVVCVTAVPGTNQVILDGYNEFCFDHVLPPYSTQEECFTYTIKPLINSFLEGYNASVIAFGQKSSGKTYSVIGPGLHFAMTEAEFGIIPRATREIFHRIMEVPDRRFVVKVSFVEMYENKIRDLLHTGTLLDGYINHENREDLDMLLDMKVECRNICEVLSCLQAGITSCYSGMMVVNQNSTLSHVIFSLSLEQQWMEGSNIHQIISTFHFCDLAGANKIGENVCGQNIDPGIREVENAIATIYMKEEVGMPCSKVTRILRGCLMENSKVLLLCCVSPASMDFTETHNSLTYAQSFRNTLYLMRNKINNVGTERVQGSLNESSITNPVSCQEDVYLFSESEGENKIKEEEIFGLEFAASQWMHLVANAEELFNKISVNKSISEDEKENIRHWLCLKQECDACLGVYPELSATEEFHIKRSLDRIDEISETEEKSDLSQEKDTTHTIVQVQNISENSGMVLRQKENCTIEDQIAQDSSESKDDSDSQGPEFSEKLDDLIKSFKCQTDESVSLHCDSLEIPECKIESTLNEIVEQEEDKLPKPTPSVRIHPVLGIVPRRLQGRRNSIHPGSIGMDTQTFPQNDGYNAPHLSEDKIMEEAMPTESFPANTPHDSLKDSVAACPTTSEDTKNIKGFSQEGISRTNQRMLKSQHCSTYHELQQLSADSGARQVAIRQVSLDLECAQRRLEKLTQTIHIKKEFIDDLNKTSHVRENAKQKFDKKRQRLEEKYKKTKTELAEIQKALMSSSKDQASSNLNEEQIYLRKQVEKYKKQIMVYERKLKEIVNIRLIADESTKKVAELEQSLRTSRREREKLKNALKMEELHKITLEKELEKDQQKIKELEAKCQMEAAKSKQKEIDRSIAADHLCWIQQQEERIMAMREVSEKMYEEALQRQQMMDKREAFMKEKCCLEKRHLKSGSELNSRIFHVNGIIKEKSASLERSKGLDEQNAVRHEIQNLRLTKECLMKQRYELDEKFQQEQALTTAEERKLLELDEAIEAVDAAIEFKNELICGRKEALSSKNIDEKNEDFLMARLKMLPPVETRTLLYKYFQKVIDLREEGRKMDVQVAELEAQNEAQVMRISALTNAMQQLQLDAERKIVTIQKETEAKVALLLLQLAEDSSGSSGTEATHARQLEQALQESNKENRSLRKRIQQLEAQIDSGRSARSSSVASPVTIPQHNLEKFKNAPPAPKTKVTREKNKLIIQQQKPKNRQ